jgi:hypothetical protein
MGVSLWPSHRLDSSLLPPLPYLATPHPYSVECFLCFLVGSGPSLEVLLSN